MMFSICHVASFAALCAFLFSSLTSTASNCSTSLTPKNGVKPSVASGYQVALIATGLTKPRSISFDSAGNLLVLQQGAGIANIVFQDGGGTCLSVKSSRNVIKDKNVSTEYLAAYGHICYAIHPACSSITVWHFQGMGKLSTLRRLIQSICGRMIQETPQSAALAQLL